jgi:hypothetical protein
MNWPVQIIAAPAVKSILRSSLIGGGADVRFGFLPARARLTGPSAVEKRLAGTTGGDARGLPEIVNGRSEPVQSLQTPRMKRHYCESGTKASRASVEQP